MPSYFDTRATIKITITTKRDADTLRQSGREAKAVQRQEATPISHYLNGNRDRWRPFSVARIYELDKLAVMALTTPP